MLPNPTHVRRAVKITAIGRLTRRKTANAQEARISGIEVVRKVLVRDVRQPWKRYDSLVTNVLRSDVGEQLS